MFIFFVSVINLKIVVISRAFFCSVYIGAGPTCHDTETKHVVMEISRVGGILKTYILSQLLHICFLHLDLPSDLSDQWFALSGLTSVCSVRVIVLGCFHKIIKALAICYPQCNGFPVLVIKRASEISKNKSVSGRCARLPHDHDQSVLNEW